MKSTISTVALVAFAAVSVAAAGLSQDRTPDTQKPATMDAQGMTITGCVARGTAADTFTLAEGKTGAPAASADATAPAAIVALTGSAVDLSKHVGHNVTLTGSYASPDATVGTSGTEKPATTATTATPASSPAPEASKKAAKTFTVKSLKMVSPTC
jgi:hypothetical protein